MATAAGVPVRAKVLLKVVAWATVKVPLTVVSTPVLAIVMPVALVRPTLKAPAAAVSSVPVNKLPVVPLPEMLKLLAACCAVPFWIKPVLSRPPSFSELKAWGTLVNCTRGVISASAPTLIPR